MSSYNQANRVKYFQAVNAEVIKGADEEFSAGEDTISRQFVEWFPDVYGSGLKSSKDQKVNLKHCVVLAKKAWVYEKPNLFPNPTHSQPYHKTKQKKVNKNKK